MVVDGSADEGTGASDDSSVATLVIADPVDPVLFLSADVVDTPFVDQVLSAFEASHELQGSGGAWW